MSKRNSTADIADGLFDGDKLYQQRARLIFPILVQRAKARQPITYQELATEIGIPNPRNLNYPLGSIGTTIKELNELSIENVPGIQAIVLNKNTGLPGEGFDDFLPDDLRTGSRNKAVRIVLEKVFEFQKWDEILLNLGLTPLTFENDPFALEKVHRESMFAELIRQGGPEGVKPETLHNLRIYEGQAGIWRDKARTSYISGDDSGLAVTFFHKGNTYPDALTATGLTFHYPMTDRPGKTDINDIEAAKMASVLRLPLFAITLNSDNSSLRDVKLGYVTKWDDKKRFFFLAFGNNRPPSLEVVPLHEEDFPPFRMTDSSRSKKSTTISNYSRDPNFKKNLIAYYGARCAVCDLDVLEVLDGAHIRAKEHQGSDDVRNGLIFCANHHRAFDFGLFHILPDNLNIDISSGYSFESLGLTRTNLFHLVNRPHIKALRWVWENRGGKKQLG